MLQEANFCKLNHRSDCKNLKESHEPFSNWYTAFLVRIRDKVIQKLFDLHHGKLHDRVILLFLHFWILSYGRSNHQNVNKRRECCKVCEKVAPDFPDFFSGDPPANSGIIPLDSDLTHPNLGMLIRFISIPRWLQRDLIRLSAVQNRPSAAIAQVIRKKAAHWRTIITIPVLAGGVRAIPVAIGTHQTGAWNQVTLPVYKDAVVYFNVWRLLTFFSSF